MTPEEYKVLRTRYAESSRAYKNQGLKDKDDKEKAKVDDGKKKQEEKKADDPDYEYEPEDVDDIVVFNFPPEAGKGLQRLEGNCTSLL